MNTLQTVTVLAVLLLATSCKKEDDPAPSGGGGGTTPPASASVQFTLDGDGYTNQTITITPPGSLGEARFDVDQNETGCISASVGTSGTDQFTMAFEGSTTGTQYRDPTDGPFGFFILLGGQQYAAHIDTLVITTYGAVGATVEGSFRGSIVRGNGPTAGTIVSLTNGTFRFRRMPDV